MCKIKVPGEAREYTGAESAACVQENVFRKYVSAHLNLRGYYTISIRYFAQGTILFLGSLVNFSYPSHSCDSLFDCCGNVLTVISN
jgi:hypothetical protein